MLLAFQHWHHLRLIVGDLAETIVFESIISELSALTDVLIDAAIDFATAELAPRCGRAQTSFTVLGLGKLGGGELNYSSDIDLIFVYDENGETAGGRKQLSHSAYSAKLGQKIIEILDSHHQGGRLYRVDMRLRPKGPAVSCACRGSKRLIIITR